jgi:hypothetical protein
MLNLADQVGHVDEVDMGEWIKKINRIRITGTAKSGGTFDLELQIKGQEDKAND